LAHVVIWSRGALRDLEALEEYLQPEEHLEAQQFLLRLVDTPDKLGEHPRLGRQVPEEGVDYLRELIVGRYRLVYEIGHDRIEILRIIAQSQDFRTAWNRSQ